MNEARWTNAFGEEVDLDDIDREYALNILTHYTLVCGLRGYDHEDMRGDALVAKLRSIVLSGRAPNLRDRVQARLYNIRCALTGKPWRA